MPIKQFNIIVTATNVDRKIEDIITTLNEFLLTTTEIDRFSFGIHDFGSATDVMKYAGKVDNVRFLIDKVNDGYKIVHIGSDGRNFFKMMKSAYGMELKVLYRLKIGNKLHKAWWLFNSTRRFVR